MKLNKDTDFFIHPLSDVQTSEIGKESKVWQYSVILEGASLGEECNINCHVFIENDVHIGDRVTVKSGVQLWDGLRIEDDVFVGPNATFVNDNNPRSKDYPQEFQKTELRAGSSIGAGAIVLGGLEIGAHAMVAAGALVTKDVPARALVMGQPAQIKGWVNIDGSRMEQKDEIWIGDRGQKWKVEQDKLVQI